MRFAIWLEKVLDLTLRRKNSSVEWTNCNIRNTLRWSSAFAVDATPAAAVTTSGPLECVADPTRGSAGQRLLARPGQLHVVDDVVKLHRHQQVDELVVVPPVRHFPGQADFPAGHLGPNGECRIVADDCLAKRLDILRNVRDLVLSARRDLVQERLL